MCVKYKTKCVPHTKEAINLIVSGGCNYNPMKRYGKEVNQTKSWKTRDLVYEQECEQHWKSILNCTGPQLSSL